MIQILTHVAEIALLALVIAAAASMRLIWTKNDAIDRTVFRVLGLSVAFSRYDPEHWVSVPGMDASYLYWEPKKLARPLNGAALGIAWSFWIYTRRHALGRAMVCDWALPSYLQINVADLLVMAESGDFIVKPARRYVPGDNIRVGVVNRNPCLADGVITVHILTEHDHGGERGPKVRPFSVKPSEMQYVQVDYVDEGREVLIERVEYKTDPSGVFTVGRLHGRPEWEA